MKYKKYKNYFDYLYLILLGIITSFSLPPYNFWIINFITFSLLFTFLINNKDNDFKKFFLYGYTFGFGYFFSCMYWIPFSLLYDDNFKFLIPIAIIFIPAILSFFYSIAFFIFKYFLKSKNIFKNILIFSLVLGLFEFIRGTILSGFPWNLFAYSFSEHIKLIQVNSIIGIYAFNTILITIFAIPSILLLDRTRGNFLGIIVVIILVLSNYVYGSLKVKNFKNLKTEQLPAEIKILSTNIPIERFYSNLDDEEILKKLIKLSKPKINEDAIFIWPEGVIPNLNLNSLKDKYELLLKKSFSKKHYIILGINNEEIADGKQKIYNSLSIIDREANVLHKYYKNKLVPFGEFLPLENILSKIGFKVLTNNYQSYSAGSERILFNFRSNIKILPLICYEIIYSGKLSKDNNYDFIVNISEDGWFGNSIGPYQHFTHSIFRSIETGKYTLRSANNGISGIVDPTGSVIDKLNINNEGVISIKEIAKVNKTLFSSHGNKIYFLIILLYIFLIFSFKKT